MQLTKEELGKKELTTDHFEYAIQALKMNGYLIIEDVFSLEFIENLRHQFMNTLEKHKKMQPENRGKNRFMMRVPMKQPFADEALFANNLVLPLLKRILTDEMICHYYGSDTPFPGSEYQDVHSDIHLLFPDHDLTLPAYSFVLNVPLVDFTEDNGPVEIWPNGTHHMPNDRDMKRLSEDLHSEKVTMKAGSILLRDMRMWHRGTPNQSNDPRPNLAFIYSRPWLKLVDHLGVDVPKVEIPRETYEQFSKTTQKLFRMEKIGAPCYENQPA